MVALRKTALWMTVDEFLRWDSGDPYRYELVDGEPRLMAPASFGHGILQSSLGGLLRSHLRAHRPGCVVAANPGVIPHLLSAHNFRVPDLAVTCVPAKPGMATIPEPILIVEILSPSNQPETWANIWTYTSLPSTQEILIVSAQRVSAELLRRGPDGSWPREPVPVADGVLALESIGFRVALRELYEGTGLT